ncbi:MAG: glycosyl hydrolase-related protein [Treponema sp.]|nr:glycosyl hydrolase-related protein [Treponema sp.]
MTTHGILRLLKPFSNGYWGERIYSELTYLNELSQTQNRKLDDNFIKYTEPFAADTIKKRCICMESVQTLEKALSPLSAGAKALKLHAVGHAHIDMNWFWRYDETVNIVLETFRTVLKLMDFYPEFIFTQSQGACYQMVEEHDPAMLERIKKRVNEGRWEVSASTWTEPDKNLPNGESMARHILYTKHYLKKLFGLEENQLRIDCESDTFGHSAHIPEILASGGIDYYYFKRGYLDGEIFNWQSPSGANIIAYRDPVYDHAGMPEFCARNNVPGMLMVFGCGDHGGGPTRRQIEHIIDMGKWPLFPDVKFSTFHSYFDSIKPMRDSFPVVKQELNFVLTGCYSSQTRVKAANRFSEAALYETELLAALIPAGHHSGLTNPELFEKIWRHVLFNQFHDILPGAGNIDNREYARGLFQMVLAKTNARKSLICYSLAESIDTSAVGNYGQTAETDSVGAGVGFGIERGYGLAPVEHGSGLRRAYLLINTADERSDITVFPIWDWPGDVNALRITDSGGKPFTFQVLEENQTYTWDCPGTYELREKNISGKPLNYWGHNRIDIALECGLPSMGWLLVIAEEDSKAPIAESVPSFKGPWVHKPYEFFLENEILKIDINPVSGTINSIFDKRTGKTAALNGGFFGLNESPNVTHPAWIIGRYKNDETPVITEKIEWLHQGKLRNALKIFGRYKNSRISYILMLDKNAEYLTVDVDLDWLEIGSRDTGMPQLHFVIKNSSHSNEYLYDVPMGTLKRSAMDLDVPALSYACSCPEEYPALAIISRDKYGFRCIGDTMSLTLVHSSYLPDPYPELGRHLFTFYIAVPKVATPSCMNLLSLRLCHPVFTQSVTAHKGVFPSQYSLLRCNAAIAGIKPAEDSSGDIIIRLYNDRDHDHNAEITLAGKISSAFLCSITEVPLAGLEISENTIKIPLKKDGMATIRIN